LLAYHVTSDAKSQPMKRVLCRNEEKELQDLLEHNLDLLPGDQISPEDPRRWLVVAREMGVPDPNTGEDRWSIDFMFVDQSGVPTFIEVKRHADTRSRREVVGQMFDYAANGHYYWTAGYLMDLADAYARGSGADLEAKMSSLAPDDNLDTGSFFDRVAENLREGQLRLVFFMEQGPMELKSIVDFLNKQMERTEVLLVEAHQFEDAGTRIVVPQLFGYTEEARRAKRAVTVSTPSARRKWDEESFFLELRSNVEKSTADEIWEIYQTCRSTGTVTWGSGKQVGSLNPKWPPLIPRSPLSFLSDGSVYFNFGYLEDSALADRLRESLATLVSTTLGLALPDGFESKFPMFDAEQIGSGYQSIHTWLKENLVTA
jgi:hypothetical protein